MTINFNHKCSEEDRSIYGANKIHITDFRKVTIFLEEPGMDETTKIIYRHAEDSFTVEDLTATDYDDQITAIEGLRAVELVNNILENYKKRGATFVWSGIKYDGTCDIHPTSCAEKEPIRRAIRRILEPLWAGKTSDVVCKDYMTYYNRIYDIMNIYGCEQRDITKYNKHVLINIPGKKVTVIDILIDHHPMSSYNIILTEDPTTPTLNFIGKRFLLLDPANKTEGIKAIMGAINNGQIHIVVDENVYDIWGITKREKDPHTFYSAKFNAELLNAIKQLVYFR